MQPCRTPKTISKNFVYPVATWVSLGKIQLAAFDGLFPKTPPQIQKNLADISYTSPAIANFVVNFVALATGVGGENAIGGIRWPIQGNPLKVEKCRKILLHKPSYSQFCFNFRCHGNGGRSWENAIGSI